MSGQVVPLVKPPSDGQKAAARSRATTIRQRLQELHGTLTVLSETAGEAYRERDWETLGYDSWSAYCGGEFGTKVKLTTDERQEIVGHLRGEASMSERAISVLLGVSQPTIHRDLSGSDSNESVVKGVNGKTYQARKPKVIQAKPEPMSREEAEKITADIRGHIADINAAQTELDNAEIAEPEPADKVSKETYKEWWLEGIERLKLEAGYNRELRDKISELEAECKSLRADAEHWRNFDVPERGAYANGDVQKLLNLAVGTDNEEEAVLALKKARAAHRQ